MEESWSSHERNEDAMRVGTPWAWSLSRRILCKPIWLPSWASSLHSIFKVGSRVCTSLYHALLPSATTALVASPFARFINMIFQLSLVLMAQRPAVLPPPPQCMPVAQQL